MRNERGLQFRTLNNYYEIATVIHRKTALFGETCVTESLKMYPESKSLSHSQRITLSQQQTLMKYFDEIEQGPDFCYPLFRISLSSMLGNGSAEVS